MTSSQRESSLESIKKYIALRLNYQESLNQPLRVEACRVPELFGEQPVLLDRVEPGNPGPSCHSPRILSRRRENLDETLEATETRIPHRLTVGDEGAEEDLYLLF